MLGVRTRHSYRVPGGELRVKILRLALVIAFCDVGACRWVCHHIHGGVRTAWIVNGLGGGKECNKSERIGARTSRTEGGQVYIPNGLTSRGINCLFKILGAEPVLAAIVQALGIT